MSKSIRIRDRKLFSGLLSLNGIASIEPTERKSRTVSKSLSLQDMPLFQAFNKVMAESFAYRVVLNGIASVKAQGNAARFQARESSSQSRQIGRVSFPTPLSPTLPAISYP